jgi:hypothetical protein
MLFARECVKIREVGRMCADCRQLQWSVRKQVSLPARSPRRPDLPLLGDLPVTVLERSRSSYLYMFSSASIANHSFRSSERSFLGPKSKNTAQIMGFLENQSSALALTRLSVCAYAGSLTRTAMYLELKLKLGSCLLQGTWQLVLVIDQLP